MPVSPRYSNGRSPWTPFTASSRPPRRTVLWPTRLGCPPIDCALWLHTPGMSWARYERDVRPHLSQGQEKCCTPSVRSRTSLQRISQPSPNRLLPPSARDPPSSLATVSHEPSERGLHAAQVAKFRVDVVELLLGHRARRVRLEDK